MVLIYGGLVLWWVVLLSWLGLVGVRVDGLVCLLLDRGSRVGVFVVCLVA